MSDYYPRTQIPIENRPRPESGAIGFAASGDAGGWYPYMNSSIKQLIASTELTSHSITLASFSDIPQNFRNLEFVYRAAGTALSSGGNQLIQLRFNGDSGNNYHYQRTLDGVSAQGLAVSSILPGGVSGAAHECAGMIDILDYTQPEGFNRPVLFRTTNIISGDLQQIDGSGYWLNTSDPIERIDVLTSSALTFFGVGSKAWLYGWS